MKGRKARWKGHGRYFSTSRKVTAQNRFFFSPSRWPPFLSLLHLADLLYRVSFQFFRHFIMPGSIAAAFIADGSSTETDGPRYWNRVRWTKWMKHWWGDSGCWWKLLERDIVYRGRGLKVVVVREVVFWESRVFLKSVHSSSFHTRLFTTSWSWFLTLKRKNFLKKNSGIFLQMGSQRK